MIRKQLKIDRCDFAGAYDQPFAVCNVLIYDNNNKNYMLNWSRHPNDQYLIFLAINNVWILLFSCN